jgi:CBS domain-containing protein
MATVADILRSKPHKVVYRIAPDATVFEAVQQMEQRNVGALLVMDGARIAGIVTERDYARKIVLLNRSSRATRVVDIMTSAVLCVSAERALEECMALMTEARVRHLPVLKDEELVGLVSIGDLVKQIISEQTFVIEQLERYISGRRD